MGFEIRGLTVAATRWEWERWKPTRVRRRLLRNVSGSIPPRSITAVIGASGAGKTTLLSLLGMLRRIPARSGAICYAGTDYAGLSTRQQALFRSQHFGFVLQSSYLLPNLTCRDNVMLPLTLQGIDRRTRRRGLLDLHSRIGGLDDALKKRPGYVSGGEQQRMAVLRALIHDPQVVFADEPCASLDFHNSGAVLKLLLDWQGKGGIGEPPTRPEDERRTLLFISHDIPTAWEIADHFILLSDGAAVLLDNRDEPNCVIPKTAIAGGPAWIRSQTMPAQKSRAEGECEVEAA